MLLVLAACAPVLGQESAPAAPAAPEAAAAPNPLERNWSILGKPLFKAVYVGLDDQTVTVQPPEGEPLSVPLADLTPSDQEWVIRYENGPAPRRVPAKWVAGYKVRFPVRITGDLLKSEAHTVTVSVPTGGWLKKDVSDILVTDQNGDLVPLVVLSHDPVGDTLIQFRRRGFDRWYFVYACNPQAPDKDMELAQKLTAMKDAAEQAQLAKMALFKDAAQKAAAFRDLAAAVELQKTTLAGAVAELQGWEKNLPEREAALKAANEKVPPADVKLKAAQAAHAPFAKVADEKTAIANELSRVANEAKRAADEAAAARDAATKAATDTAAAAKAALEAMELAVRAQQTAAHEVPPVKTAATTALVDAEAAKQQLDAAG